MHVLSENVQRRDIVMIVVVLSQVVEEHQLNHTTVLLINGDTASYIAKDRHATMRAVHAIAVLILMAPVVIAITPLAVTDSSGTFNDRDIGLLINIFNLITNLDSKFVEVPLYSSQ